MTLLLLQVIHGVNGWYLDNSIPITRDNMLLIWGVQCTADWDSIVVGDLIQKNSISILLRQQPNLQAIFNSNMTVHYHV